jgi:hypothetical protein
VADGEVGGQVEAWWRRARTEEHERSPLDGISKNIVQTTREKAAGSSVTAKGRSAVEGGRRPLHM